jgi:hypothetical protein
MWIGPGVQGEVGGGAVDLAIAAGKDGGRSLDRVGSDAPGPAAAGVLGLHVPGIVVGRRELRRAWVVVGDRYRVPVEILVRVVMIVVYDVQVGILAAPFVLVVVDRGEDDVDEALTGGDGDLAAVGERVVRALIGQAAHHERDGQGIIERVAVEGDPEHSRVPRLGCVRIDRLNTNTRQCRPS